MSLCYAKPGEAHLACRFISNGETESAFTITSESCRDISRRKVIFIGLEWAKNCTSTLTPTSSLFPFFLGCYVLQFLLCATVTLGPVHTLISTHQKNHNPFSSHFNETSPAVPTQAEPTHLCPKYKLVMTIVTLWFVDHHSSLKFCIIAILSFLAPEMTIFGPEGGACDTIYFI